MPRYAILGMTDQLVHQRCSPSQYERLADEVELLARPFPQSCRAAEIAAKLPSTQQLNDGRQASPWCKCFVTKAWHCHGACIYQVQNVLTASVSASICMCTSV